MPGRVGLPQMRALATTTGMFWPAQDRRHTLNVVGTVPVANDRGTVTLSGAQGAQELAELWQRVPDAAARCELAAQRPFGVAHRGASMLRCVVVNVLATGLGYTTSSDDRSVWEPHALRCDNAIDRKMAEPRRNVFFRRIDGGSQLLQQYT